MSPTSTSSHLSRREALYLGLMTMLGAVLFNRWSIGRVLAPDQHIFSEKKIAVILTAEALLLLAGLWLLIRPPKLSLSRALRRSALAGAALACLFGLYANALAFRILEPNREFRDAVRLMVDSEELILTITPELGRLTESLENLELPDHQSRRLFAPQVSFLGVAGGRVPEETLRGSSNVALSSRRWTVADAPQTLAPEAIHMWQGLLEEIAFFEHAKFYPIEGAFTDEAHETYELKVGFNGLALLASGGWASIHAEQMLGWRLTQPPTEKDPGWRIEVWHLDELETLESGSRLFEDVLDQVVRDPDALERARGSIHEQFVERVLLGQAERPIEHFTLQSWDRHPGVSVVDIDGDGHDDLYVMDQWGVNMLFRNLGDGTFEEIAAEVGLDIEDHTASAIFADFDNDGDQDAILGRTLERSLYLVNENGRFVDRSEELVDQPLPYLVSAVSAVDINMDGLLDIYFSTYSAQIVQNEYKNSGWFEDMLMDQFLAAEDARTLFQEMASDVSHIVANKPGPPNVLLRNLGGGRFAEDRESNLFLFKNSYQSTFADFDRDGDPDVYCANDFAPNNLLRNDGNGRFVDVTQESGTADIGFGMGASWGDYDNDGRQDLYVANMFSKAGKRITAQVPGLNPMFAQMARGNSLFRNVSDSRFDKVSGPEPPAVTVEIADWSYGSQFVDVDNDGYLDVYAPSGYYTAPDSVAIPRDT